MLISLSKYSNSENPPNEIRVRVKVSAADDLLAQFVESHSFNLHEIQEGQSVAVNAFDLKPKSADLRKYGKKLFGALFSETESSSAWRLLQDILPPRSKGRILLHLNGDDDLDVIPWEYAWGNNTYLASQCKFARLRKPKEPQPSNFSLLLLFSLLSLFSLLLRFSLPLVKSKETQPNFSFLSLFSLLSLISLLSLPLLKSKEPRSSKLPLLPLRIVTVIPNPIVPPNDANTKQFPDLHLSDQFQTLFDEYENNNRTVLLQRVFPPTVDQMYKLLRGKPEMATVLHFMGHCGAQNDGTKALVFEDQDTGMPDFVGALSLDNVTRNLRLAFLSACDTRSVARDLAEHGVPYTIGSYCSLPDDLARKFESKFYQCLVDGCTVETAMLEARASMKDPKDIRQRSYYPGAMVLYAFTSREEDGMFKCEEGKPTVEAHMPFHNLEMISTTRFFCGRKDQLIEITRVLRRMAKQGTKTCPMYTIEGIAGQGKTALAEKAVRQTAHLFPGGIFAWQFNPSHAVSAIEFFQHLGRVIFQEDFGNDFQALGPAIIKKFDRRPTSLLVLDQSDVLKCAHVRGDEDAVALVEWLQKIMSIPEIPVRILATSRQRLDWSAEEDKLDGLTGLDIDSGVELFIRNLDAQIIKRMKNESNATPLLQDLVGLVDGHPLCLESLHHAVGLPQYRNASLEELVREHFSTMLVDGSDGKRNLGVRFGPTINNLPTQQQLQLYMCSLFTGPITEGVLALVRYFVQYVEKSTERFDSSIEAILKNLQNLCDSKLLSKNGEEYMVHAALRVGVRHCNSMMRLRLSLLIPGVYDDTFVIGVAKPSKHGISMVFEWQLRRIRSEVKNRVYGVQYYDIVDIPGTSDHKLERDGVQQQTLFGGLVVFRRKASEILHISFPKFCMKHIIPIVTEKKSPFILCLHYTDIELVKRSIANVEKNIFLMKKATETLRSGLEKTHFIIRTESLPGIIHGKEKISNTLQASNENQQAMEVDFSNVNTYGEFVGRQQELQKLEELLSEKRIRYITIRGFGGMGKTALAIQAVKNFNSGTVLVISLAGNPSSDSVISTIAGRLNIDIETSRDPKIRQNVVMAKLTSRGAMLFYLDNMEDVKHATEQGDPEKKKDAISLIRFFHQLPTNIKILATSRIALGWPNEQLVELTGIAPHYGMQIFRQWASQRSGDIDDDNAKKISSLADGHPLSIRLLGGVFNNCMEPVDEFIKHISDRLRDATDYLQERYDSVDKCIQYSFDYLDDTLKSLLGQLKIFEVPFSATLAKKILDNNNTLALSAKNHLHKLWQQSWLNELKYDSRFGDWRPRFMENDTRFYTLHPRLRDFLNHQFGDAQDMVDDLLDDSEIQFYTALCYGEGFGVANDLVKQKEWCIKAAKYGHLEAQLTVADCYEKGGGAVDVDKKAAFKWYLKAAEAGDKGAQEKVINCFEKGNGVEQSDYRAYYWVKRAYHNTTDSLAIKFDISLPLLHRAVEGGHVTIVGSLLNQPSANVELKDRHGRTPLHLAAEKGDINVLELLVFEFNANTNAEDKKGNTPIHHAAGNGHVEFTAILIAVFGADSNAKNIDGCTPLYMAVKRGHIEVVRLLVAEFGANTNAMNFGAHIEFLKLLPAWSLTLDLKANSIFDKGAKVLAESLKDNTTLTRLDLYDNSIGEGAQALAEPLKQNTTLTQLNLGKNKISDKGARDLAESLKHNTTLTHLFLEENKIGNVGARALAESLKHNTTLTHLYLKENKIGDKGALALAESLKHNTTLTHLYLEDNNVSSEMRTAIDRALMRNITSTKSNLNDNGIDPEGALTLAESLL